MRRMAKDKLPSCVKVDYRSPTKVSSAINTYGFCVGDWEHTERDLLDLTSQIGKVVFHDDANEKGIMNIIPDENKVDIDKDIGGAFTRSALPPHTDGKGIAKYILPDGSERNGPAEFIVLDAVHVEDPTSAMIKFCDGEKLYKYLKAHHKELLSFLCSENAVKKYTTQPNFEYSGPVFEIIDGLVAVRFNILESKNWKDRYLRQFLQVVEEQSFQMQLCTGQTLLFNNRRMLHWRTAISDMCDRHIRHILVYTDPTSSLGRYLPLYSL